MNTRPRIKICGITSLDAAEIAVAAGADALGFVFYEKSPRYVTAEQAQTIIEKLPPFITKVGLFVNHSAAEVHMTLATTQLDVLQFHGQETEDYCRRFRQPYIKAIGVRSQESLAAELTRYPSASALLLDAYDEILLGGTGQAFDWRWFPQNHSQPLILAGGLTPENIAEAIQHTQPYAVDVSSGVESSKGVKDKALIQAFIKKARAASCHSNKIIKPFRGII